MKEHAVRGRGTYTDQGDLPDAYLFFLNGTTTTEIYTLSLHDALPIWIEGLDLLPHPHALDDVGDGGQARRQDRKSTRLNSSHVETSYAVFCLKKKTLFLRETGERYAA